MNVPAMLASIAETYVGLGRLADAGRMLHDARTFVERTGPSYSSAEILRIRGRLAWEGKGETEAAHRAFCEALACARRQGLGLYELRVATDLADFLRSTDGPTRAAGVLAPVYARSSRSSHAWDHERAGRLMDKLS